MRLSNCNKRLFQQDLAIATPFDADFIATVSLFSYFSFDTTLCGLLFWRGWRS